MIESRVSLRSAPQQQQPPRSGWLNYTHNIVIIIVVPTISLSLSPSVYLSISHSLLPYTHTLSHYPSLPLSFSLSYLSFSLSRFFLSGCVFFLLFLTHVFLLLCVSLFSTTAHGTDGTAGEPFYTSPIWFIVIWKTGWWWIRILAPSQLHASTRTCTNSLYLPHTHSHALKQALSMGHNLFSHPENENKFCLLSCNQPTTEHSLPMQLLW